MTRTARQLKVDVVPVARQPIDTPAPTPRSIEVFPAPALMQAMTEIRLEAEASRRHMRPARLAATVGTIAVLTAASGWAWYGLIAGFLRG